MPLKVVLDTNVVVFGTPQTRRDRAHGAQSRAQPAVVLFVTPDILAEYQTVLESNKFGIDARLLKESLLLLKAKAITVFP